MRHHFAGVCTAAVLGVHARVAVREWAATVREPRFAILTVTSVPALAYVMNLSGQAATIGHFVAAAGTGLAFLSPVLGWFGVAVSGSDTSANALFGALQVTAARESGLSPELLAAARVRRSWSGCCPEPAPPPGSARPVVGGCG